MAALLDLGTTWRHRASGEVATLGAGASPIYLVPVDLNGEPIRMARPIEVRDEAELRRDWEQVRRGWVVADEQADMDVLRPLRAMLAKTKGDDVIAEGEGVTWSGAAPEPKR